VSWSYSLLDAGERLVFDRLGVFAGPFDAQDAASVVAGDDVAEWDVLDTLASLVQKSMLVVDEDVDGVTRFQMLETIRTYARERLEERGESNSCRRKHAQRYTELCTHARDGLFGPDELRWRRRLHAELDNIRAAVVWALDESTPEDHRFALSIIADLATEVQGDRASGYGSWATRALVFADEATPGTRAAVLACAALDAYERGDLDNACVLAESSVRPEVPVNCPCPSLPFVALAATLSQMDHFVDADAVMTSALEHVDAIHQHPPSQAILLGVRSIFRAINGNTQAASHDATAALRHARELESPLLLVLALSGVASASIDEAPERARSAIEESIALTRSGASDMNFTLALRQLALLDLRDGDTAGALDAVRAAIIHDHANGVRPSLAGTLLIGCELLNTLGYVDRAAVLKSALTEGALGSVVQGHLSAQLTAAEATAPALSNEELIAFITAPALAYEELIAFALDAIDAAQTALETLNN
jgi:hypothetical protein